jgi:hypothetical protein
MNHTGKARCKPSPQFAGGKIRLILYTCRQSPHSTKEPDIRLVGEINQLSRDEFDSFIEGRRNPILLGERETSLRLWLEEV